MDKNRPERLVLGKNEVREVSFDLLADSNKSVEIILAKPGARVMIFGSGRLKNKEIFNGRVKIIHQAPNTFSRVNFKGVLFNSAEANIDGLIRIENGAKSTDSFFRADFLLFDEAKARPFPFLEILDNDVKVGHAATIAKIDEDQLFYLMSRGLTRREATKMIIDGFLKNKS